MKPNAVLIRTLVLAGAMLAGSVAQAAITMERDITLTDDGGGTLVLVTSALHEAIGSESLTTATFTDFQPFERGRRINGEVLRDRMRTADAVETTFNGSLEIAVATVGDAPERLDTLVFEDLTLTRTGRGRDLTGTVIYNGEEIDAAELPRAAARVLRRTLRFFHYA